MTPARKKQLDRILAYCNRIRKKMGKKPIKQMRKGYRGLPCQCPIAHTIGLVKVWAGVHTDTDSYKFTKQVSKFINEFDAGLWPELEAK